MKRFFTLIAAAMTFMASGWSQNTVVDIVVNSEDHTLLELAVIEADLAGTLSGPGPFTLFAPTDAAITALATSLGTDATGILALPNLADILTYHAVADSVVSGDLMEGATATTIFGADVTFSLMGGAMVNDANIGPADIIADNGVVHVIDAVLLTFGCTDENACNYDAFALVDDGSCGDAVGAMCDDGDENTVNDMVTAGCGCAGIPATVVDIVVNSPDHTVLETAVVTAGLVETLSGEGPFTVFAPTDAAFTALLEALGVTADDLLSLAELTQILTYHVAGVNALSTDLTDGQMVTTVNGQDVTISIMDGTVMINGTATVTVADLEAGNGVVHVIDAVLVPAVITGCTDAMACNFSPVANDDDMSCELPGDMCDDENWLTENDTLNADCECVGEDIQFATVVDIVVASPIHELLEAAVLAADLAGALSEGDSLTVFAPTDDAIGALVTALEITAEDLLALPNLAEILQYHVVGAVALSTDLSDGQEIPTLQGANVNITINTDTVMVNDAMVIVADLMADNGVVHVIDAVLLPPTPDSIDEAVANWTVMPNPAKDIITLAGVAPAARIAMIDLTGRTVREFAQGTTVLSVGDMPRGTYLLTVTEGRNIQTKKVMVQ